jgi:hypothetical protein
MDEGQHDAFAGALDNPPTSTWEIINPRDYEKHQAPPIPLLPDIHPLVDKLYRPYDIGQVGQLDVHILTGLFGGDNAARDLTPAWDGGIYWAGQLRSATTPAQQDSTASIALFYLSVWKSPASARAFTRLYAGELGRKYSGLKPDPADQLPPSNDGSIQQAWTTDEGPVLITTRGKMVFVSESFPIPLARKLTTLILDAQGTGAMQMAQATTLRAPSLRLVSTTCAENPSPQLAAIPASPKNLCHPERSAPGAPSRIARWGKQSEGSASKEASVPANLGAPGPAFGTWERTSGLLTPSLRLVSVTTAENQEPSQSTANTALPLDPLTGSFVRFFSNCGVMKAAIDAEIRSAHLMK